MLNGFRVEFSSRTFQAFTQPMAKPDGLRDIRNKYGLDWFIYWRDGIAYGLPRVELPKMQFGGITDLTLDNFHHLQLAVARLSDVLPTAFPQYDAFSKRPFSFLGKNDEIVGMATQGWKSISPLLSKFEIRPRFELEPKIVELQKDDTAIALIVRVSMKWSLYASISALKDAGVDLQGLAVVRRNPNERERRLVGTIESVDKGVINLQESFDNATTVSESDVWLEGSKASFTRCLKRLLKGRYDEFDNSRYFQESQFLTGPALDRLLKKMSDVLAKLGPIKLAHGLTCTIKDRISLDNRDGYDTVVSCGKVEYCFDAAKAKRHIYPWVGIQNFGPFSKDTFPRKTPRILIVTPDQCEGKVEQFVKIFRDGIQSLQQSYYQKGFGGTFGLHNPEFVTCRVPMLGKLDNDACKLYQTAINNHIAGKPDEYHAALVAILDHHAALPDNRNPYLYSKAALLQAGIPTQEIRHATLTSPPKSLQYSLQNISVAMYAKMGGTPWTIDHDLTVTDELVIGMGVAELSGSRFEGTQRFVGITTVFRGDGNYLLSNVAKTCKYDEYPIVLRDSTVEILRAIKERNGWQKGDTIRLVFHAQKPLKKVEVAQIVQECVKEAGKDQFVQFAFLTVNEEHPFRVFDTNQHGKLTQYGNKGVLAPERGTIAQIGRMTRLLCTNGPTQLKRATAPHPAPLLLHLHEQSDYRDLSYLSEQALKFTSLTWKSTLPAHKPVTIYYSELIARLLGRLQHVPDWSPAILNSKLRSSRWFL